MTRTVKECSATTAKNWPNMKKRNEKRKKGTSYIITVIMALSVNYTRYWSIEKYGTNKGPYHREEASKREREKAVQRMREQNERKVGRDREKFVKEEETMHFKALLSEKVQYGSSVRTSIYHHPDTFAIYGNHLLISFLF